MPAKTSLVLRTVAKNGIAHGDFKWPKKGLVKCPDWKPSKTCGNGLHGCLHGEGDGTLFNWNKDALWQVVEVETRLIVKIDDAKVKFPRGKVVYTGTREKATAIIQKKYPGAKVIGAIATAGYAGQATAGYYGQATAVVYGKATAGHSGQATAGAYGQATAGTSGQATAGDYGQATAGHSGQATAGNSGKATAGHSGQATAGDLGSIHVRYWDGVRYRTVTGYIGEGGLKPRTAYKLNASHTFVVAK